ncbi:D-lactate dehydrogenase [Vibrio ishigakensis]|uniref:D-lactate dehydrogenase n=1 Tax=Vibrio ishigakensis TaxID=1481914 RepID=A0A0B8PC66_9VIBR|nr:D-lactate dehydrogenase [Vibrio ishigakensis]
MLHLTCSNQKLGHQNEVLALAKRCSSEVIVPEHVHCCGFAGTKGVITPELNESALIPLKAQVPEGCSRGFSTSATCEIGLSRHSGIAYQNLLYLVDEVSSR